MLYVFIYLFFLISEPKVWTWQRRLTVNCLFMSREAIRARKENTAIIIAGVGFLSICYHSVHRYCFFLLWRLSSQTVFTPCTFSSPNRYWKKWKYLLAWRLLCRLFVRSDKAALGALSADAFDAQRAPLIYQSICRARHCLLYNIRRICSHSWQLFNTTRFASWSFLH